MFRLTILFAGLSVLVAGNEINTTSTASPKVRVPTTAIMKASSTTTPSPQPFAAVMDIFQAPLAAFKPKMEDEIDRPMGRNQQSGTPETTPPTPSNIFFKAGNGLGSAASSLTGWFNNRMLPQALRPPTSTTPTPEVIAIIPSQQVKRKIFAATENVRRPQGSRQRPVAIDDPEDLEDEDQDLNNDEDDDDNGSSNHGMIENDAGDQYDYAPVEKRKTQKRPNRQYFYIEEELADNDDSDSDYDVQVPVRKTQQKRRKNPPKKNQQQRKKPVRRLQNPQIVQVVQDRPNKVQVKRKRRPATTFELVPISQNQAMNSMQKKKPSGGTQNNQQRPLSQFLNIPWTRLGFAGPPKEQQSTQQQAKPIIVRIPQQNTKPIKRRPTNKPAKAVKNPKRKPLRGQVQHQSPVFAILSEDEVREIFQSQFSQSSKTTPQTSNLPVSLTTKKKPSQNESNEVPSNSSNNNNDMETDEKPQDVSEAENHEDDTNAYIVVGPADDDDDDEDDDKEIDLNLYRHYDNRRGLKRDRGRSSPRLSHKNWRDDDYEYDD